MAGFRGSRYQRCRDRRKKGEGKREKGGKERGKEREKEREKRKHLIIYDNYGLL